MNLQNKATSIHLFDFSTAPMRAFHMTWLAFFMCFFGWFGIAPLMPVIREELGLTQVQIGNLTIASVAITILCRLVIGWLCDKIGPRKSYMWLLILGSLPVMGVGLSNSYESFLVFRLAIGAIGASFVITQYHTSLMFAPNVVGTANATTAGWGNLGGGVTQMVMPLLFSAFLSAGVSQYWGWRLSMVVPGALLLVLGLAYFFLTKDTPDGDFETLKASGQMKKGGAGAAFLDACKDYRVWALFVIYGACFGIELTINNIAALYFTDYFGLGLTTAGVVASLFGLMNIFARTLGGVFGDRFGKSYGLKGRVYFLGAVLFAEGLALMLFSQMTVLSIAIATLILFSLCVQMSEGATYSVVPFINKKALGAVSGIVGAGGNAGAVAAGFLFRNPELTYPQALMILGVAVTAVSSLALLVRFSRTDETAAKEEMEARLAGGLPEVGFATGD